jgi:hypothetical protein
MRKKIEAGIKLRAALEAYKGEKTMAEIGEDSEPNQSSIPTQISPPFRHKSVHPVLGGIAPKVIEAAPGNNVT